MSHSEGKPDSFKKKVNKLADTSVENCYQCGKCTAGCPMAEEHDKPVHLLMRLVQLDTDESREAALKSSSIWTCLSCETCSARCPKDVKPAEIIDVLRELSLEAGIANITEKNIQNFHKYFLKSVKNNGRVYELGLMMMYKLDAGLRLQIMTAMNDAMLGPPMLMKGKLGLLPEKGENPGEVKKLFKKLEAKKKAKKNKEK